jgi:hypothetical protein
MIIPFIVVAAQYLQELQAPTLTRVIVEPAAVWIVSNQQRVNPLSLVYVYDKPTARWRRAPAAAGPVVATLWPDRLEDRVLLAPGYNLALASGPDAGGPVIISRTDSRTYVLRQELTAEDRRWLKADSPSLADLPVGGFSQAWTRAGNDVWFGLGGGYTEEGSGGLGGLVHVDLGSGRVEWVRSRYLLTVTVSSLAVMDGALWIGTLHPGECEETAGVGLLRYDLKSHEWQRYTADSSALPSDLIWMIAADGNRLWVTTPAGIAALETRSRAWKVWSFALALHGDTMVHELVEGKHPSATVRDHFFNLMTLMQIPDRQAFLQAWLTTDTMRFSTFAESGNPDTAAVGLAQPPMAPFLVQALNRRGAPRSLAAIALGRLGDPRWIPALRAVFDPSDTDRSDQSVAFAVALTELGDSTGVRWVRRMLDSTRSGSENRGMNFANAIHAAGRIRDGRSIPDLTGLLRGSRGGRWTLEAYSALWQIGTPDAWLALARNVTLPREKRQLFSDFLGGATGMPVQDSAFRAAVSETAVSTLRSVPDAPRVREDIARAADVVVHLARIDAWPQLVELIKGNQTGYQLAMTTLIRLTGVDSVPAPPVADSLQRARADAFWRSWFAAPARSAGLRAVAPRDGDAALDRWRRRWADSNQAH